MRAHRQLFNDDGEPGWYPATVHFPKSRAFLNRKMEGVMVIEEINRESKCISGTLDDNYAALEQRVNAQAELIDSLQNEIEKLRWYQEVLVLYENEFWTERIEARSEAGAEELKAMFWKAWEDMGRA
jgi:hypothetical protein